MTTVIFAGDPVAPRDFTREATKQEYFPEWFLNISALVDTNVFARTYDQEQWQHAFGLTALAARVDNGERRRPSPSTSGSTARPPQADGYHRVIAPSPALFFAVLQEVGPDLTNADVRRRAVPARARRRTASPRRSLSWGQHDRWPGIDGRRLGRHRRHHQDLVGSRGRRPRRDPQRGRGPVAVRRRRQALPGRRVAGGGLPGLRRGGHVDDLRRGARERSATGLRAARPGQLDDRDDS